MAIISKLLVGACMLSLSMAAPQRQTHKKRQDTTRYLFSMGSSSSSTGFDLNGEQPSPGNPTGNPAIGSDTFSGGLVFPEYLATVYNTTYTQLYDLAVGGATISDDVVPNSDPSIPSFEDQVHTLFEPKYSTPGGEAAPWSSDNAFFTLQFGINDVHLSYKTADMDTEVPALMEKYRPLLDSLYADGARKFMIMGVTPLNRSPSVQNDPDQDPDAWAAAAQKYNDGLVSTVNDWASANSDAELAIFTSNAWLSGVLDNPTEYGFDDATCEGAGDSNCIWWEGNDFHLTSHAQSLMAQAMLEPLTAIGW